MATLEKKTLTGLFGEKAGAKLFKLLTPCCQLTFRAEATCEGGNICTHLYATSPITQTTYIQFSLETGSLKLNGGQDYSFIAGKEVELKKACASAGNPAEGTYSGFAINLVSGEPAIGYTYSVDVPFCDG